MTCPRLYRSLFGHAPCLVAALWLGMSLGALPARAGSISATLQTQEPVLKAWAVLRQETTLGVYGKAYEGTLKDGKLVVSNLDKPGHYDLRFETASGLVEGWDATIPPSDYEQEQPLGDESRKSLIQKMGHEQKVAFDDEVLILDIQGNIHNAVILTTHLRTKPFYEGLGVTQGVWVWRVGRSQWEYPDEVTWTPKQDQPYYALYRERLKQEQYQAKRMVFARHLGGISLTPQKMEVELGTIHIPKCQVGIAAVNPDGTPTKPVRLKPRGAGEMPSTMPSPPASRKAQDKE